MGSLAFLCLSLFCLLVSVQCFKPMSEHIRDQLSIKKRYGSSRSANAGLANTFAASSFAVYIGPQDSLKDADAIESLPGQPQGVDFAQYSGYVTVNPTSGRALFYYFSESPQNSSTKPLVLWLNGGPGCSSLGAGAMMELGPFRVNKDNKTLSRNKYAWNNGELVQYFIVILHNFYQIHLTQHSPPVKFFDIVPLVDANIIFLESPAGVGFSYSNTTSDYKFSGDNRTAQDSYTFLINWLERFPEYKTRDFYITGESYAGHYVPQLAQTIVHNNKNTNQTVINLKGIAIGNALIDDEMDSNGSIDFFWSHAFMSDEVYKGIELNCNFSSAFLSDPCIGYLEEVDTGNIYAYNVYAPLCGSSKESIPISAFDACSEFYIASYLNTPEVQAALHANITALPYPWEECSGDIDGIIPVTSSRYSVDKLGAPVKTPWYPWYIEGEIHSRFRDWVEVPSPLTSRNSKVVQWGGEFYSTKVQSTPHTATNPIPGNSGLVTGIEVERNSDELIFPEWVAVYTDEVNYKNPIPGNSGLVTGIEVE
ncbi:hypothetical protein LguiB_005529 [Lonicera macranthoides]